MHVMASTVEALIVVCGRGPDSEAAALEHIVAVDPPSAKVQLEEVQTVLPYSHLTEPPCSPRIMLPLPQFLGSNWDHSP